ncbi:hypothetical protein SAMN05443252_103192 [Bacillus sp. OV322]|uniref:CDI toxin immunity protein n=1 Tax=Bacillus sp. OV322 TaxID=1882764 RepID=UPI0008E19898|nr:hypothetical protein [Bacillus sp. OV322]SFC39147.1 hypothetical protein SAMN05443252_103192 [Bacillus sp. OV322]
MNEQQKAKLARLLHVQKQKAEEQERMRLVAEVLNSFDIRDDVFPLTKEDGDLIMNEFVQTFPIAEWGRIDWEKVKNKVKIKDWNTGSIKDVLRIQGFDLTQQAYLLYSSGDFPFVKTSVQRILSNFEELTWIGWDQFIYCPTSRYVIEYFHDGDITIGWY